MRFRPLAGPMVIAALLLGCGTPAPRADPPTPPPEDAVASAPAATPTPPPDPSGEALSAWAPLAESEREWIRAVKARQPSSWAAHEPQPHVVILHDRDVKPDRVRRMGEEVVRLLHDMAVPRFPPGKPIDRVLLFRVCKDATQYGMYGGPGGTDGYWSSVDGESVLYDDRQSAAHGRRSIRRLAVTQYLHLAGAPDTHPWFRAGVALLLAEPTRSKRPERHPWMSHRARAAAHAGVFLPLDRLVSLPDMQFATDPSRDDLCQAWSLAWFLDRTRDPRWAGGLERYFLAHRDRLATEPPYPVLSVSRRPTCSDEAIEQARAAGLRAAFGDPDPGQWGKLEAAMRKSPVR